MPEQMPPGEWIRRYCQLAGDGGILCRHAHNLLVLLLLSIAVDVVCVCVCVLSSCDLPSAFVTLWAHAPRRRRCGSVRCSFHHANYIISRVFLCVLFCKKTEPQLFVCLFAWGLTALSAQAISRHTSNIT